MNKLMCGLALSLAVSANGATANQVLTIDGQEHSLASLTEKCQSITGDPAAQIACFNALSALLEEQSNKTEIDPAVIAERLSALRAAAEYQDEDTGLAIGGSECTIHLLYFGNYFHISRRNVSTIDLFSAQFDASKLQYDQTVRAQGGAVPLSKGVMASGAAAAMRGGVELDSSLDGFEAKSARSSLGQYAGEVVRQLQPREDQTFEFVLVHPKRSGSADQIWSAFESYVKACQG
jgi:hypothetical protein